MLLQCCYIVKVAVMNKIQSNLNQSIILSFKKMHLKISKRRSFCSFLNMLGEYSPLPATWWTLTRSVKLRVAHAPGTFSPSPRVSDPDMHHGTCVTHVPWCMPGSLTSSFVWSGWQGKRSRHSGRMHNPQCYVSGKRPMTPSMSWIYVLLWCASGLSCLT